MNSTKFYIKAWFLVNLFIAGVFFIIWFTTGATMEDLREMGRDSIVILFIQFLVIGFMYGMYKITTNE